VTITNSESGTNVYEIADGIYRISTPAVIGGGVDFSFNQYLIIDDDSLLFHTGPRKLFPLVCEAVESLLPMDRLRYISFSHFEADECGSLNEWLAAAPLAQPLCGTIGASTSISDLADRPPRGLSDGESLSLGAHSVTWLDSPHVPHGWDCGYLLEETTRTLFCGDLFTQPGADLPAITESDILGPSEAFRFEMDYYSHGRDQQAIFDKLAATEPTVLACMHGSAWRGDGAKMLRALADAVAS
jgi:flavorubredoxin